MRWVLQLAVDDGVPLDGLPGVAARHEPGSRGPADATWDVVSDGVPDPARPGVRVLDAVALAPLASVHVAFDGPRIKRTLLLRVHPGTPSERVERFERELAAMPRYIASIRSWSLSRVDRAVSPSRWTHVWEQEYESVSGLRGEYMMSPYHWAGVDRWFDHEIPDAIVADELIHVFYATDGPVLR
jgi:Stress responsive A/B Barrel Domain